MDDFAAEVMASGHHDDPPERRRASDEPATPPQKSGLRSGLAAIRERAGIQDRLVDRLLQQVIPADDGAGSDGGFDSPSDDRAASPSPASHRRRPGFNLTTMSYNFRHFNARIGVVFQFQADVERLFAWTQPTHTLSFLAVYSLVCLDPYLLPALPMVLVLLGVLVPSFVARHPAPPRGTLSSEQAVGFSPRGPPLAPAATVRPAKELSRDFFRNMRDLQNSMGDFSRAHDKIVELMVLVTNFSDEALSSTVFLSLSAGGVLTTVAAHMVPWRLIFLCGGWALVLMAHPAVKAQLHAQHQRHVEPCEREARSWFGRWVADDIILDSAPETREVEIFELQRASASSPGPDSGEWEPWLFSPSPYDPLSPARISGDRPRGTRFFEDVLPPAGWEWSEKKWALDLWSREWVEERIITGVEVETEGERWVYDMYDDEADDRTGVVDYPDRVRAAKPARAAAPQPSWEEGEDGTGRRGEWRRRRWVRLVKRKAAPSTAS